MRQLLYAALVWSVSACYVYAPTEEPVPEMGREVRANLSTPKDLSSGDIVIRDVTRIDGMLYGSAADTLVIWSKWLHGDRGGRYFADGEVHPFLRGDLESLEVRQLNVPRTALTSAVVIGVGFGLFAFAADLGGGGGGEPGPDDRQGHVGRPMVFTGVPVIR